MLKEIVKSCYYFLVPQPGVEENYKQVCNKLKKAVETLL